jgi:hypothetical protein
VKRVHPSLQFKKVHHLVPDLFSLLDATVSDKDGTGQTSCAAVPDAAPGEGAVILGGVRIGSRALDIGRQA